MAITRTPGRDQGTRGNGDSDADTLADGASEDAIPIDVTSDEADEEDISGVTTPRMAHDAIFKHLFGEPQNAAEALRSVLPPDVVDVAQEP